MTHAEILAVMKEHFGKQVAWVSGKKPEVPEGYLWAVQLKALSVDETTGIAKMAARILLKYPSATRKGSEWVSFSNPGEIRRQISLTMRRVAANILRDHDVLTDEALIQGRKILRQIGADAKVCRFANTYLDVCFPSIKGSRPLECLIRFDLWTGREPHRRKWRSKAKREQLYCSQRYAWIVYLDFANGKACIYYANCLLHKSKSDWFEWTELHEEIIKQTNRAYQGDWRESEYLFDERQDRAELDPDDPLDAKMIAAFDRHKMSPVISIHAVGSNKAEPTEVVAEAQPEIIVEDSDDFPGLCLDPRVAGGAALIADNIADNIDDKPLSNP